MTTMEMDGGSNVYEGCSDGNCVLRLEPLKVHTNGGCRCLRDVPTPLRLAIQRKLRSQHGELQRLRTRLRERDAVR